MHDFWPRLEAAMARLCPEAANGGFLPGASPAQIEEAERIMDIRFPADLRDAYLRHNGVLSIERWGVDENSAARMPAVPSLILPFYDWCDLELVVAQWRRDRAAEARHPAAGAHMVERAGHPARLVWSDRRWIPVASPQLDMMTVYVDMNPSSWGTTGQLIECDQQAGKPHFLASSFSAYLAKLTDFVEQGLLLWDRAERIWLPRPNGRPARLDPVDSQDGRPGTPSTATHRHVMHAPYPTR